MQAGGLGRLARWAAACLAAAALALALSACGGDSSPATAKAGTASTTSAADVATGTTGSDQGPPGTHPGQTRITGQDVGGSRCAGQVGNLLAAMDRLRSNLVAGLAYEGYVAEMKKIMAAYEAVPTDEVALGCLRAAGTPGEKALNRYIAASNTWTDCVEVPSCEAASIEAQLQSEWRRASKYLSKAQAGLKLLPAS